MDALEEARVQRAIQKNLKLAEFADETCRQQGLTVNWSKFADWTEEREARLKKIVAVAQAIALAGFLAWILLK